MASLIAIQADVQQAVRIARFSQDTLKDLGLDTPVYTVKDKDGKSLVSYEGRDKQETAQLEAENYDFTNPENGPHYVEATSNIDTPTSGSAFLTFVEGAKNEIEIPLEEIRNAITVIGNAVDCERIEQIIKDQAAGIQDYIKEMLSDMDILGGKVDLTKVPSDPMELVGWAKKFVSKYLAPNLLATLDLMMIVAEILALIIELVIAIQAAIQNLLLCAASALETAFDEAVGILEGLVTEAAPGLDKGLQKVGELQAEIVSITGTDPIFDTTSVNGLIESATAENRAQFLTNVDGYLLGANEVARLSANTMSDIANTVGPTLAANATLATTTLVAANCFTGDATIPGASTGGTNGKFEIITGKGSFDQVRYIVRNGIIEDVIVGL
jgi:hypothetical protein